MANNARTVLLRMLAAGIAALCMSLPAPAAFAQGWQALEEVEEIGPYTLQPGDTLIVNVLEDPELDAEVMVLPDGRISLPVAGTIEAGGLTPQQLAGVVRNRLSSQFVEPPDVTVTVTSIAEPEEEEELLEVFVLGEVARPGRYEYDPEEPITVIKALTLAGGLGPFAARERIQVRELVGEIEVMRLFDYEAFEDGLIATSRDLALLSDGAVIVVPERGLFE